jgi:hypothetical protein
VPARLRTPEMQSVQASVTSEIHAWMIRHELLPAAHASTMAAMIGTFCCRCSPHGLEHGLEISQPEDYHVMARLLAVLLCLDDPAPGQQGASEVLGKIASGVSAILAGAPLAASPWLGAVSELLRGVAGPAGRDIETFKAAFLDHWDAVQEETRAMARAGASEPVWTARRDWLADYLRLRPLLIGTEPYLRCWQTLLGCWPAPSLVRALEAEAPAVRRAHPHPALDHALDVARHAHAGGRVRRAPALSELDALAVVSTYLANDLGSRERDQRSQGPGRDPNLVLLLARYFLGRAGAEAAPGNPHDPAALERAEAVIVDMYNIAVSRFRAFRTCALAAGDSADTRLYLSLLARIVDGNLRSTIEHTGEHPGEHTGGHPGEHTGGHPGHGGARAHGAAAPGAHGTEPRYSSLGTLKRLDWIRDQP